jgi:oligosaccharide repeat unit polymerase
MTADLFVFNVIFFLLTTLIALRSIRRIINYTSYTIADYINALIYVFMCIPVLCDVVIGIPKYVYWVSFFSDYLVDFNSCIVYNIYVAVTMFLILLYAEKAQKKYFDRGDVEKIELSNIRSIALDVFLIVIPLIVVIAKYGLSAFTGYTTLGRRVDDSTWSVNQLIILSIYVYITRFYSKERKARDYLLLLAWLFLLSWINGKRYIIVTILEMILFMYQQFIILNKRNKKTNLRLVFPIVAIAIVLFSVFYRSVIKVTAAADYMYGSIRVDFGRDDVTKYVIKNVLIDGKNILEYPGQSFLNLFFFFIPRGLWPSKPYAHYRYLTAHIFGTSIFKIPAGITPSLFEMSLCNFGWFGFPITPLLLIVLCRLADKNRRQDQKLVYLLIITNLLTQSMDAYLVLIGVLLFNYITNYTNIRITFKLGKRGRSDVQ